MLSKQIQQIIEHKQASFYGTFKRFTGNDLSRVVCAKLNEIREETCLTCNEPGDLLIFCEGGHKMHQKCIDAWIQQFYLHNIEYKLCRCPICKGKVYNRVRVCA